MGRDAWWGSDDVGDDKKIEVVIGRNPVKKMLRENERFARRLIGRKKKRNGTILCICPS